MVKYKTQYEIKQGIKFSKRGIIEFIEQTIEREQTAYDKKWQLQLKTPSISYYLKKGGSELNKK